MPSCFWYQTAREVDFLVKNNNNFNSAWVYLCFPSELHPLCLLFQPPHTHKHVSANSDKSPLEVCQWLVISGPWRGCRPLRLREHCGLCTLGTKPVLWVVQEDLEEGHPSTRTPPCYLLNTSCQILSSSSQMLKFKKTLGFHQRRHCWCTSAHTVGEVKQKKNPVATFAFSEGPCGSCLPGLLTQLLPENTSWWGPRLYQRHITQSQINQPLLNLPEGQIISYISELRSHTADLTTGTCDIC